MRYSLLRVDACDLLFRDRTRAHANQDNQESQITRSSRPDARAQKGLRADGSGPNASRRNRQELGRRATSTPKNKAQGQRRVVLPVRRLAEPARAAEHPDRRDHHQQKRPMLTPRRARFRLTFHFADSSVQHGIRWCFFGPGRGRSALGLAASAAQPHTLKDSFPAVSMAKDQDRGAKRRTCHS